MNLRTLTSCALIAAGIALPAGAGAFAQGMMYGPRVEDQRPQPGPPGAPGQPMPQRDMRDLRDLRGMGQSERGRMSPEERRQLRQDIQNAGRDIYRGQRQGRGEQRRGNRR